MITIDLNCDIGESYGAYHLGNDEQLFSEITSANIACGYHAGDPAVMRRSVRLALEHNVAIGAHPGLPDLIGFGRRKMDVSPQEVYDMMTYQIGALQAFVQQEGGILHHVKPHGALYNMAAESPLLADAAAQAIARLDSNLVLYGLAGSELVRAGRAAGLNVASEVFADRTYQSSGALMPRSHPQALITDPQTAVNQIMKMLRHRTVTSLDGQDIPITADTICIHGDGEHALTFVRQLKASLLAEAVHVCAVSLPHISNE